MAKYEELSHLLTKVIVAPEVGKVTDKGSVVQDRSYPSPVGLDVIKH